MWEFSLIFPERHSFHAPITPKVIPNMSFPCLHLVHAQELPQPTPPTHKFQYIMFGLFRITIFQISLKFCVQNEHGMY